MRLGLERQADEKSQQTRRENQCRVPRIQTGQFAQLSEGWVEQTEVDREGRRYEFVVLCLADLFG